MKALPRVLQRCAMSGERTPARLRGALRRVGGLAQPRLQLAWLCDFARREDLATASAAAIRRLRLEIGAFAVGLPWPSQPTLAGLGGRRRLPDSGRRVRQGILALQARVRDLFAGKEEGQVRQMSFPLSTFYGVLRDGVFLPIPIGTDEQRFYAAVFILLVREASRLRVCGNAACAWLFPPKSGKQRYCRPACSQRSRSDRYSMRHASSRDVARRRTYESRRQARLGDAELLGDALAPPPSGRRRGRPRRTVYPVAARLIARLLQST